jgi:uncharacterized protein (TIGR00375 family)
MGVIADLHIHGRFSRATSKQIDIENLEKYARIKGVELLGTGDFTHPEWIKELKRDLNEDSAGILRTKNNFPFILQTEISLIYTQDGKGRRIHNLVLAPSFDVVDQITEYLKTYGRVDYDGRPIFKIPCDDFVYELKKISKEIEVIPAHIWTPWFSMFGSMSGFDSVKDCFKDQTKNIFALETGLSSDPAMNWRLSQLDKYTLVSNSDMHSFWPWRIGREANIIEVKDLSYKNLINAIKDKKVATIEVDPSYGKYHYDGHRKCKVCMKPSDSIENKNICPKCKRKLTIGVLHRVEELADREEGFKPKDAQEFKTLIPLSEVIAALIGSPVASTKVWKEFNNLISAFGSEFNILLKTKKEDLARIVSEDIVNAIIKNRNAEIVVIPGYDGEYGIPVLSKKIEKVEIKNKQLDLNNFS